MGLVNQRIEEDDGADSAYLKAREKNAVRGGTKKQVEQFKSQKKYTNSDGEEELVDREANGKNEEDEYLEKLDRVLGANGEIDYEKLR